MPTYEYQCKNCGHEMEVIQKITEDVLKRCPECGKNNLERLISATSFQLKGSGWYATDFKDKPSKPKEEVKSETTTEVKPETKTKTET